MKRAFDNQERTIDISMDWETAIVMLVRISLNCKKGAEQDLLEYAAKLGKQVDDLNEQIKKENENE